MRYLILALFLKLAVLTGFSQQNQSPEQLFLDAEYYRLYEEYSEALPLYTRLLAEGVDNAHIHYRIGECYLELPGRKEKAIPHLEKAVQNISKTFKEGSFKETHAPVYSIFYLGKAYQIKNQLDKALEAYNKFMKTLEDKDEYNMSFVNKQIQSCKNAQKLIEEPVKVKQENAGNTINTSAANIKPVVSKGEDMMLFTTKLKFYDAVFMSRKEQGEWQAPVNLTPQIKSDGNLYSSSLDKNANRMLLLKSNPYNGDLYVSELDKEKKEWKEPRKLGKTINSKYWETHGCFCDKNTTIFFTSNRKGGMGGLDIYVSHYDSVKNEWGPAKNLGEKVNTPYNEETPFMTEDGKRLYFSSQGHYGMGGFDIFYTEKLEDGQWSEPINIGYPINTTDDDLFFCPVNNGEAGYIARYGADSYGNQDIYRIEFIKEEDIQEIALQGTIKAATVKKPGKQSIDLRMINMADSTERTLSLDETLSFSTQIKPGRYKLTIQADGYSPIEKTISIGDDYSRKTYEIQPVLQPQVTEIKEFITIDNVYFGYDSYSLTAEARQKMDKLVEIMKQYPDLKIDIIGHTDSKGSKEYNEKLSKRRSESVRNYLVNNGIDPDRMTLSAKGESYPIAINTFQNGQDAEEGRKYNRRVEIVPVSTENKYIISKATEVPNDLRNRGEVSYTILLTRQQEKLPEGYFKKFELLNQYTINEYYNGQYLYLLGRFSSQDKALNPYQKAVQCGFEKARILSSYQLKDILKIDVFKE